MNAHHLEVADVYVEDGIIVAVKPHIHVLILFSNFREFYCFDLLNKGIRILLLVSSMFTGH